MRRIATSLLVFVAGICSATMLFAQEQSAEDLEAKSLPLRTALYHDPTLAPPLERLVQLYQSAGRLKELVNVYRQHITQYPADVGALTVLVRLLAITNDTDAGRLTRSAAESHQDNAYLQFLLFEHLRRTRQPGALDALDRAITKEQQPARKRTWVDQLLPLATAEGRPELARRHLEALAESAGTAEEKLEVARKMIAQKLHEPALSVLTTAATLTPSAELGVEIELAAASAELGLGRNEAAGVRLDRLLGRLAADYWRRGEILHRRIALVKTDAERETMVSAARARWKAAPDSDNAALELSQLLAAFEFRREALAVLLEAAKRVPASEKIEKAALDLFDRLQDEHGREAFLTERLRLAPERQDLALARSRSLFLLGRGDEALKVFDGFAAKLDPPARLNQTLELARFLRRSTLHANAAELFSRAVELAPSRMEVRRELAETWLALGQKQKARDVFTGASPDEAESENLLDVVQFFIKEGMLTEAKDALAKRVAREPQNFDLRLMQITVAGHLADQAAGRLSITGTLPLADTDARYRRWLEAAVAFHEVFETDGEFLAGEQTRLLSEADGWSQERAERRLIFAEVASAHGQKAEVAAMLQSGLSGEVSPEVKIELRRRQLALLENDPAQSQAAEEQLNALLKDDAARADEYRIRLALLYVRNKRADQAAMLLRSGANRELVAAIDIRKVNDAALLTGLEGILRELGGDSKLQLDILDRLTELEPGNRGAWERWITALAGTGNEERLRIALQRLLAGMERLPLSAETRELLQQHLLASFWRSISMFHRQDGPEESRLSEVLPLLESAGRLAKTQVERLWITWAHAYTLNRLGRNSARDEAIREFERLASTLSAETSAAKSTGSEEVAGQKTSNDGLVVFPDGLSISLTEARRVLTDPGTTDGTTLFARPGPKGKVNVRWAFNTDRRTPIMRVVPINDARVLIVDSEGKHYCVESESGKLVWARNGAKPISPQRNDGYSSNESAATMVPPEPLHDQGRLFIAMPEGVECWSADRGELLWRAQLLQVSGAAQSVYPALFAHNGRVLVCNPFTSSITSLDGETGKTQWQRDYPSKAAGPLTSSNSGASFSDGRILIYGSGTRIVSADNGDVLWSFEPDNVKEFPISLGESGPPPATPVRSIPRAMTSYRGGGYMNRENFLAVDYLQRARYGGMSSAYYGSLWSSPSGGRMALVNPGAAWTAAANQNGQASFAVLHGKRLLLFSSNALYSLRLDMPFRSPPAAHSSGTFIGASGRFYSVLSGNTVNTVDSDSGQQTNVALVPPKETPAEDDVEIEGESVLRQPYEEYDAVLDGMIVYVSGRTGVSGCHTRTGQRIFELPWPAALASKEPEVTSNQRSFYYMPQGIMRSNPNGPGTLQPLTGAVGNGVLYIRSEPSRLVALVEDSTKKEARE